MKFSKAGQVIFVNKQIFTLFILRYIWPFWFYLQCKIKKEDYCNGQWWCLL